MKKVETMVASFVSLNSAQRNDHNIVLDENNAGGTTLSITERPIDHSPIMVERDNPLDDLHPKRRNIPLHTEVKHSPFFRSKVNTPPWSKNIKR